VARVNRSRTLRSFAPLAGDGAVSSRGSVAFVCSECYEEFILPASYSKEMVTCPECQHVGKRRVEEA